MRALTPAPLPTHPLLPPGRGVPKAATFPVVIPAKAGIHLLRHGGRRMDSRFRGNDRPEGRTRGSAPRADGAWPFLVGADPRALPLLWNPSPGREEREGRERGRGEGPRRAHRRAPLLFLLALPALAGAPDPWQAYGRGDFRIARDGFEELARERPGDLRLAVDLGSARYQEGDFAGAEEAFARAARSAQPEVAAQALYSLGNAVYRQDRLEEAIGHWQQTLNLDPRDEDARFNLELARRELERRRAEQPPRQPPAGEPAATVSEREARRLLAALGEQRPTARPARQARRTASGKDW